MTIMLHVLHLPDAPVYVYIQFLLRQAFADDEASTRLLQILLFLVFSTANSLTQYDIVYTLACSSSCQTISYLRCLSLSITHLSASNPLVVSLHPFYFPLDY